MARKTIARQSKAKNALINKPRRERPPMSQRDVVRYPKTMGDVAEERELTFEEQLLELCRCKESCEYFISQYCTVIHPKDGMVPCILYEYQRNKVLPAFMNERFVITRKFRQGGFSTVAALTILWMMVFQTDLKILVVSKGDREAVEFMGLIKHAYDYLPEFLRVELIKNNEHVMETVTGCKVGCYTPKAGVSFSCKLIVIDEAAHIEQDMHKVWGKIYPVVSTGGSCWVISTCNGVVGFGEWYYKTWTKAKTGENFFFPLDVAHTEHPDYCSPDWEEQTRANIGEMEFRQQYLREFMGVANSIFKEETLKALEDICSKPIRSMACPLLPEGASQKNLFFFEEPMEDEDYILITDPAEGLGSNDPSGLKNDNCDFASIQVIALSDMRQVAEYQNDAIKPQDLAKVVTGLAKYYRNATVVCEASALGQAMLVHLRDICQYDNIYSSDPARKMGLVISNKNRPIITTGGVNIIDKAMVSIRSARLIHELRTLIFDAKTQRIDHLKGYHDDLFTALAYGYYVRENILASIPYSSITRDYKIFHSFTEADVDVMMERISSQESTTSYNEPFLPSVGMTSINSMDTDSIESEENHLQDSFGEEEGQWRSLRWGA